MPGNIYMYIVFCYYILPPFPRLFTGDQCCCYSGRYLNSSLFLPLLRIMNLVSLNCTHLFMLFYHMIFSLMNAFLQCQELISCHVLSFWRLRRYLMCVKEGCSISKEELAHKQDEISCIPVPNITVL